MEAPLTIYHSCEKELIEPLFESFTAATGIPIQALHDDPERLIDRLQKQSDAGQADMLLSCSVNSLITAKRAGVLQSIQSNPLLALVPAQYRDPDGFWYGFSVRAQAIFFAKERLAPLPVTTYESLADARWRGRLCMRSSRNHSNRLLVAALLHQHGVEKTAQWAKAVAANLARAAQGDDREQLEALAAGQCDMTIAEVSAYALMLQSAEDNNAARQLGLVWPNQDDTGVHADVSGGGIIRGAKQPGSALRFLEFMTSDSAQQMIAAALSAYPVVAGAPIANQVAALGAFRVSSLPLSVLENHQRDVELLLTQADWR